MGNVGGPPGAAGVAGGGQARCEPADRETGGASEFSDALPKRRDFGTSAAVAA